MNPPNGLLGINWGDEPAAAAKKLGWACQDWQPWPGGGGYEDCTSTTTPITVFGQKAWGRLVRNGPSIEGVGLVFPGPDADVRAVRAGAIDMLHLRPEDSDEGSLYITWNDGSLVRLSSDDGHSATLTVAGPRFGGVLQAWLLKQGLIHLGGSLRAH